MGPYEILTNEIEDELGEPKEEERGKIKVPRLRLPLVDRSCHKRELAQPTSFIVSDP